MKFFLILFILSHPILYGQIGKIPMQSKAFYPGKKWVDQNGININAHGGGVMFYNNLYYWYGQHMIEGKIGNTAQVGVHLYSSSNLYNWKDEGIVFKVNHDKGSEIEKGCIIERPKVVYNKLTNTFVMWFHLELINQGYDAARAGVAISNSPYGPFKYIKLSLIHISEPTRPY